MKSLNTLSTRGSELTTEQLDNVDGGLLGSYPVTVYIDGAYWGTVLFPEFPF